ncbi:RNA-binding S4 domain-containing protein [Mariniplasma sp. M4Ah]|jgi:ribosomal 50S subunit-recycling heat shock protein|uniref:RNA-binding S4 domain-containing protein n=2 Tax=Peloplasma aerotolerans TaxID=3044389 RepID=A0AAW6U913_9MOLU|nr:RNA-binding S4 domain-containing protein [Mariniplasma sp. M4Ah]MDI6452169.1 RNA-binding S4 domain-containing protein [Mariniplasma sp. M4Ah]
MAMRLDKFLKVARIIKRRTVAKEAAEKSKVEINGKVAKPSSTVNVGDVLTLHLGLKIINVKVMSLEMKKDQLMYELLSEEKRP